MSPLTVLARSARKGSPSAGNSNDRTKFPLVAGFETLGGKASGGKALHLFASAWSDPGRFHIVALSGGNAPGIQLGTVHLGLNPDSLFVLSVGIPGFTGILPSTGSRAIRLPMPRDPILTGTRIWLAHVLMDPIKAPYFTMASSSVSLLLP